MSNLQQKTNALYGIECFLRKQNIKTTTKKVSDITASFLKEAGMPFTKFNPRYKGLFTAAICNAELIQKDWKNFSEWVISNINIVKEL